MEIYAWNVNGIRAVKKKGFLDWLAETKPDILGLQEIRIQPEQLTEDLKEIEGYHAYFNCGEVKGYSGVAIYTKEEPEKVEYGIGVEEFDREGRIIIAHYPDFTLLNIYFPNGRSSQERLDYKMDFYDAVLDYCQGLREDGKSLVVCGDYNTAHQEIDLKNPEDNRNKSGFLDIEREWIDSLIEYGYVDTFRHFYPEQVKYSWWSYRSKARERNSGWRIDYHFVSQDLIGQVKEADVLTEVMGSDHCPVLLELEFE